MAAPSGLRNARDERTTTSTCYHAGSEEKPVRFVSPPLPYTSTIAGASYKQEVLPAAAQAVAVRSSQTVAKANFSYGGETLQILQELFSWHSRTSSLPTLVCRKKIYAAKATKKKNTTNQNGVRSQTPRVPNYSRKNLYRSRHSKLYRPTV